MRNPARAVLVALVAALSLGGAPASAQQDAGFGDPTRLAGVAPIGVRAVVDWDELITETAGGATPDQFHQAVFQTFRNELQNLRVPLDDASPRFLLCRVETIYETGLVAFAVRVELHEPFADTGGTAITWHRTWLGTTPIQGMHRLFTIGEQCAQDFHEVYEAQNP